MISNKKSLSLSDTWRKTPVSKTRKRQLGLTSQINVPSTWTTSIVSISHTPIIVVGAASTESNFFILENTAKNKLTSVEGESVPLDALQIKADFSMAQPSYSLSAYGNKIISSGPNGAANLYSIDTQNIKFGANEKCLKQIQECVFNPTALNDIPISPPNTRIRSVKVSDAVIEPTCTVLSSTDTTIRRVIGIQSNSLYHYDIPTAKVLASEMVGKQALNKVSFSSHSPFGALVSIASQDSSISIMDTRLLQNGTKSIVWSIQNAHQGEVNDVQFNTFLPFWLASAGDDGVVKLWDIRYLKGPLSRIDGHYGAVTSMAWSNTHCDIIATTSMDRSCRAWSFSSDEITVKTPWKERMVGCPLSEFESEEQLRGGETILGAKFIGDYNSYDAPVLSVSTGSVHADTFFTLSAFGTVSSHTIPSKMFENLIEHRFENANEREVESAIYNRQICEAYEAMVKLSRNEIPKDIQLQEHEAELIKLCTMKEAVDDNSWSVGAMGELSHQKAQEMLKSYSYGFPPNFSSFPQWKSVIPQWVQLQYDLVVFRHQLATQVKQGNFDYIFEKEKSFILGLEADHEFIDNNLLYTLLQNSLLHKYQKGMQLIIQMSELLADIPKYSFDNLSDILTLIMFPTVYDSDNWLPDKELDYSRFNFNERQRSLQEYLDHVKSFNEGEGALKSSPVSPKSPKNILVTHQVLPDGGEFTSMRKAIRNVMGDTKLGLPMLSLEMRMINLIEKSPEDMNEAIVNLMQNVLTDTGVAGGRTKGSITPYEKTISAITNRLYLDALLDTKRYEDYFGVAINFIVNYYPFDFSKSILRQMDRDGIVSSKQYILSMMTTATTQMNSTTAQTLITGLKLLKDVVVLIIKITGCLMEGMEGLKSERDSIEVLGKMMTIFSNLMLQSSPTLLKTLENLDKLNKTLCKETAHAVHDALRDAARLLPLSANKARPTNANEKAANGLTTQEEAFILLEKIYKGYLKTVDHSA
ncbi:hypothetical protein BC833DRAFT_586981 [Globomyces pollinis-pini]|nr:hypothetical protein BC833DRAFT_586981 [Globomyces pollinis-pini]